MNELRNRGVEDILIAVVDGLEPFPRRSPFPLMIGARPASSISSAIPWISPHGRTASRSPPNSRRSTGARDADLARKVLEDFGDAGAGCKYPSITPQKLGGETGDVIPFFAFPVAVRRNH